MLNLILLIFFIFFKKEILVKSSTTTNYAKTMALSLSEGDFLPNSHRFNSPRRSSSPTIIICLFSRFYDGGYFLPISFHGSYHCPSLSEGNYPHKPPWIQTYIYFNSLLLLPFLQFTISQTLSSTIMSDRLRKSVQDLNLGIDDEPVALTSEFCSQAAYVNRFSLVVTTVNPRKQNLRALIGQMPRVWGFPDSCVGRIIDKGRVQFKFQSEEAMNLVLRRGPWSFNDWMLSIHRWYPNLSEAEMKIIPFWVQITGIPLLFLTNAMARCVGNRLGHVADVDFDENSNHTGFVRVRINWNLDDPLRFQRNFQFADGENTVIKFRFERLRNFCTKCGSLKHDIKACTLSFDNEDPVETSDDDDADDDDDHHDDNKEHDISDTDTLQTVDPATLIPGLQSSLSKGNQRQVQKLSDGYSVPCVIEDTDLTVERLRYLHAKLAGVKTDAPVEKDLLLESSDNAQNEFVFMKRKRVRLEEMYQQVEAADEMGVLSQLCKKGRKTESAGSCSIHDGRDGGAGGPVPLRDPI